MNKDFSELDIRGEWVRTRCSGPELEYGRVRNATFDQEGQNFVLLVELYKPRANPGCTWLSAPTGKLRTWASSQVIVINEHDRRNIERETQERQEHA